jgi:hypothetical protein
MNSLSFMVSPQKEPNDETYRIGRKLGSKLALWKDRVVADDIPDAWDNENEASRRKC